MYTLLKSQLNTSFDYMRARTYQIPTLGVPEYRRAGGSKSELNHRFWGALTAWNWILGLILNFSRQPWSKSDFSLRKDLLFSVSKEWYQSDSEVGITLSHYKLVWKIISNAFSDFTSTFQCTIQSDRSIISRGIMLFLYKLKKNTVKYNNLEHFRWFIGLLGRCFIEQDFSQSGNCNKILSVLSLSVLYVICSWATSLTVYCVTQCCGSGSGIRDPVPFWPLETGSGIGFFQIPDLGSRIPNPYFWELSDNFLCKKFYNSLKIGPNFFL